MVTTGENTETFVADWQQCGASLMCHVKWKIINTKVSNF